MRTVRSAKCEVRPPHPSLPLGGGRAREGVRGARCQISAEHGFTLLEVIIALAILGVTFALAMQLLAAGVRSAKAAEDYTHAALLARQKMGEIVMKPSFEGSADGGELGGGFRWVSEVQPLPQEEELPALLYRVWVRVTWPGRRGEKSLDLTTLRMAVDEKKFGQTRAVQ